MEEQEVMEAIQNFKLSTEGLLQQINNVVARIRIDQQNLITEVQDLRTQLENSTLGPEDQQVLDNVVGELNALKANLDEIDAFHESPIDIALSPPDSTAVIGVPYDSLIAAMNGVPPYIFVMTSGEIPLGLTLNEDGRMTGIPEMQGLYVFRVDVEDSEHKFGTNVFSITVSDAT